MSNSNAHRGSLFIIAAPSGGGKTSLVNALLKQDPRLVLSISHTTRAARPGEIDGQHYYFVSEAEYDQMVNDGDFMEYARVFDFHYGTNRNSVALQLEQDRDVILEIDWQGARQVRNTFPECCLIFIIPPSLEVLRERLTARRQDSEEVIQRRMRDAQSEISHWAEFDHLVVNDNFDTALEELRSIINDYRNQKPHKVNKKHLLLAQQLGRR
ncbi:MAG: guanylate kinase [Xanthomonadales bacterium]|nr:guanylate kinase [Xanthomonadales bacterium]MDH4018413.1 guanylate kinase [Xanthomonadales bacterium]